MQEEKRDGEADTGRGVPEEGVAMEWGRRWKKTAEHRGHLERKRGREQLGRGER